MNNEIEETLLEYERDCDPIQPPCHEEIIVPLFDICIEGDVLSDKHFITPAERIKASYPEIGEDALTQILSYLDDAEEYCEDVCCCFSRQYGTPFVPHSENAKKDMLRIVKICKNKYPWLQEKQIMQILNTVCWLSNR